MRALQENPLWQNARTNRKYQHILGTVSGIFLAVALFALFDGLLALMRKGTNELEFIPGQSLIISGPAALKNPVNSDVIARFTPEGAPLSFELEGFFSGYWFGNGMWRGKILADMTAEPGEYEARISFKGAPAQSAQMYRFLVFADHAAMRAASLSWIRRYSGINPFVLSAWAALAGVLCGMATYWFGRRFAQYLTRLGLCEVYSADAATSSIWCLVSKRLAPQPGLARMILDADGNIFGEARSISWQKGKLKLSVLDEREIPHGALVCLRHPDANGHDQ